MTINSKYFILPPLQQVLHSKIDGSLLSNGVVTFYKDNARTIKKDIFMLTGSPPDYSYEVLPNPLTLSSIGSFVDGNGNNIIPLLRPYDESGNVELYYITVVNEDDGEEFTVQGYPHIMAGSEEIVEATNYIPNGQFLFHNYISETGAVGNTVESTVIAYGGWTFDRSVSSTATDKVTVVRSSAYKEIPSENPRYSIKITCEAANPLDQIKRIAVKFDDVNKFASNEQAWTLCFYAKSVNHTTSIIPGFLKNYGTSGSTTYTKTYPPINVTTAGNTYNVPIIFGDNKDKVIGVNDDDYLKVFIDLPTSSEFSIEFTNFALMRGDVILLEYPVKTTSQTIYEALSGFIDKPAYDGSNLHLPLVVTKNGISYDTKHVGQIYTLSSNWLPEAALLCNGASYDALAYNETTGIPYRRLSEYYHLGEPVPWNIPMYGTGWDRCTANGGSPLNIIHLNINAPGSTAPNAHDGTIPTGFTFVNDPIYAGFKTTTITCTAGSAITAGSYFVFYDTYSRVYVVWYEKDGAGTKPNVAADWYIKVTILSTFTAPDVGWWTHRTINGRFFAVPDYQGKFLRGVAGPSANDPDKLSRSSSTNYSTSWFGTVGNSIGTNQGMQIQTHYHSYTYHYFTYRNKDETDHYGWAGDEVVSNATGYTGGNETRPINQYVIYYVGY